MNKNHLANVIAVKYYIPKENLGTEFGIIFSKSEDNVEFSIKKIFARPKKDILQVPRSREYYELRKLHGLPYRTFPPERFRRPYKASLKQKGVSLPWKNIIPHRIYQKELKLFIKNIIDDFFNVDLSYYFDMFKSQDTIFNSLEKVTIDKEIFTGFSKEENNKSNDAILKTFLPTFRTHGLWKADPIIYNRLSTVTGRLTVESGPKILNLKKEYRKCMTSQWGKEGSIYFLDYKSLEPRLLLSVRHSELEIPKDPYLHAAISMGVDGEIDRKHIKTAIISMIYGAGDKELVKQLKPYISYPDDFIASIKEHFGVDELKEKLKAQNEISKGKFIYNHYGRPILSDGKSPYVLVNYFIQSTAVDVALYGFSKIVNKLNTTGANELIKPLFILHDALILDVHNSVKNLLTKLTNLASRDIPKFENTKFWLSIEKLD